MTENKQTRKFDAEVGKVLNLMIHSLYTNKEIFLRELISNASDACDKLRYLSQLDHSLLKGDTELKIDISINKEKREITISDNGIGMNYQDLTENLGTIARSGTQAFVEQMTGDVKKDNQLIGQFGVGFYSSYMVADNVKVISRKAGEAESYVWESKGDGEYTIDKYDGEAPRGTSITLHIKEEEASFVDAFRLKHVIKTYSDHVSIPINFIEEDGKLEKINSSSALWTRPKSEITTDQYKEFYKSVSFSIDDPWLVIHNKNEGLVEYTNLLFVPSQKTFDLFHPDRKRRVKLYIKKVFITDENADLVPHYLRFIRGVVDSEDLPLNISRETLQHNTTLEKIKASITKRVLSELKKKKEEVRTEYETFWQNFGSVMKEGLCEGLPAPEKLLELCLFRSALQDKMITLDEYISNMKDEQKTIYYLSGEDANKLKNSPQIEGFISKNIDVLLFTDTVDDFWVNIIGEYKGKEIKSVTRASIDLADAEKPDTEEQNNDTKDVTDSSHESLIAYFKQVLGNKVKDVKISKKLTSSPVCLVVSEGSMDIRMERFLIEQKQLAATSAKILELNTDHKIIKKIESDLASSKATALTEELVNILFDQACIIEGEPISDASLFSKTLNNLLAKAIEV
ncbi:MAG: htpG [Rickettsiaceae bacterium]|jgi:molecular chaperone HtpG|nr:htpG [Rickettsiaceae bacterium]